MNQQVIITIPEPCHENWLEMIPTEKGKFCSNCQRNVIDFTKASDKEILLAYNKNENLCGRFRISQLERKMISPKEKKSLWIIATASVISVFRIRKSNSKSTKQFKN